MLILEVLQLSDHEWWSVSIFGLSANTYALSVIPWYSIHMLLFQISFQIWAAVSWSCQSRLTLVPVCSASLRDYLVQCHMSLASLISSPCPSRQYMFTWAEILRNTRGVFSAFAFIVVLFLTMSDVQFEDYQCRSTTELDFFFIPLIHWSAKALNPLPSEVNNNDHLATIQWAAEKLGPHNHGDVTTVNWIHLMASPLHNVGVQQDNTPQQTTNCTQEWFQEHDKDPRELKWPPNSSDHPARPKGHAAKVPVPRTTGHLKGLFRQKAGCAARACRGQSKIGRV